MNKTILFLLSLVWLFPTNLWAEDAMRHDLSYRRFTTHDGLPQMQVERIWQDSHGYIYIGTLSGFVRYDGRTFTPYLKGQRINIVQFAEVESQVRALTFGRQWLINGEHTQQQPLHPDGMMLNIFNALDLPNGYVILEDDDEKNRRLCRLTATGMDTICTHPLLDQLLPDRKLFVDSTSIYLPTPHGLYRMMRGTRNEEGGTRDEEVIHRLTDNSTLFSLCRYGNGLLAFGSDSIYTIENNVVRACCAMPSTLQPDYGLIVRGTRHEVRDARCEVRGARYEVRGTGCEVRGARCEGTEILMADGHSLYTFDGDTIRTIATGFNLIKDMFVDRWERLWVATYEGVYCYFNRHFINHTLSDENDVARAVGVTGGNHLVMGTLNGKVIIDGKVVSDQPDNFFVPSAASIGGCVYMACMDDVISIDSMGHLTNLHLPYGRYQFVSRADGKVIIGTRQMVLAYNPQDGRIDTLATQIRHPWCAASDGHGNLYVGSTYGLYEVRGTRCEVRGARYEVRGARCEVRGTGYEVRGKRREPEVRLISHPKLIVTAMASDEQGHVYYATNDSLFLIRDGESHALNSQIPQISGHEVRALHVTKNGTLVVAAINALFVCRIDGDGLLTDIAQFNHLNGFTLLEPQKTTMAEKEDGTVWLAGVEAATSFIPDELLLDNQADTFIAPPRSWWQHWWAVTLIIVLTLSVLIFLTWLILQKRNRYNMQRLARAKKLKELQVSAIRLKSIPHFHSNVLAGIEYFLMNDNTAEATRYLKLYSDFTNQTLANIDRPARTVEEELDYTRKYLTLEQLRYGERLQYHINVGKDVDMRALLPTMLLHTYCQNAVKHGIGNRSEGGCIDISIDHHNGATKVSVKDNGVGREAAARLNHHSTHQGLLILMEQVELYNQTNSNPITQDVTDLKDSKGNAIGTLFEMTIPDKYQYN